MSEGTRTNFVPDRSDMALDALVLGTVNAPYRRSVSSTELVSVLATGKIDSWLVHISTFFTDVRPDLVIDFADAHGIGHSQLQLMYALVKGATGEASKEMEEALAELAQPA